MNSDKYANTYKVEFVDEAELDIIPANTLQLVAEGLDIDSITRVDTLPTNPSEEKIYEVNGTLYYYDNNEWHSVADGNALQAEIEARQEADESMQEEIDALEVASDVKDVVGTKSDLDNYDTSSLEDNSIIKVLTDETHDDKTTYYRYVESTDSFVFIGATSPYYTKSESDSLLAEKQDLIDANHKLASNLVDDTTSTQKFTTEARNTKVDNLADIQTIGNNLSLSNGELSATDTTYSAGTGLNLSDTEFSVDTTTVQEKLTAGDGINISGTTISADIDALSNQDWDSLFTTGA